MGPEEILELLRATKEVLKAVNADIELRELQAKNARITYDAFIKEDFTPQQAISLVVGSMKASK